MTEPWFNVSYRKIGGIHWLKIGRFCFGFCLTESYRSLKRRPSA